MAGDKGLQNAMKDGMLLLFDTLFTDRVELHLMDMNAVGYNSTYGENPEKGYLEPPKILIASWKPNNVYGTDPINQIQCSAYMTVPAKEMIRAELEYQTEEDIQVLMKSKVVFNGEDFDVIQVKPKTFFLDMYQFCDFILSKPKHGSV